MTMTQTITFESNSFNNALHELKNKAIKTIFEAIKNGIGGQNYCWYTDSFGQDWVVELNHKDGFRDNPNAMVCWKRDGVTVHKAGWEPEDKSLLKFKFDVSELSRFADQCCWNGVKCYKAQLWRNSKPEGEAREYSTLEEAERDFRPVVSLAPYDKVEVSIEPVYASVIECEAYKAMLRDRKLRERLGQ